MLGKFLLPKIIKRTWKSRIFYFFAPFSFSSEFRCRREWVGSNFKLIAALWLAKFAPGIIGKSLGQIDKSWAKQRFTFTSTVERLDFICLS